MGQREAREGDTVDGLGPGSDGMSPPDAGADGHDDAAASAGLVQAEDAGSSGEGDGPVRRALIRATLRLPDGTPPPPREPPIFTMHQQSGRGSPGNPGNSGNSGNSGNAGNSDNIGNTWGGQQPRKSGRRRGGQSRHFKNGRAGSGQSGNSFPSGNQARPEGRPGAKSRSSRRGRGRSR